MAQVALANMRLLELDHSRLGFFHFCKGGFRLHGFMTSCTSAIEASEHQRWRSVTWPPLGCIRCSHSMHTLERAFAAGQHGAQVLLSHVLLPAMLSYAGRRDRMRSHCKRWWGCNCAGDRALAMTAQVEQKEPGNMMHVMHTGSSQPCILVTCEYIFRGRSWSQPGPEHMQLGCTLQDAEKWGNVPNTAVAMSLEASHRFKQ